MANKNYNNKRKNNNSLSLGDSLFYSMYNENEKVYNALRIGTKNSLNPYYQYLNEAIIAEEKKGEYEIAWKKYDELAIEIFAKEQKLKIEQINPQLKIYFDENFTIDDIKDEKNKISYEDSDIIFRKNKNEIEIYDEYLAFSYKEMPFNKEIVEFNKKEVEYEITGLIIDINSIITNINGKKIYKIKNIEDLEDGWNVTFDTSEKLNNLYINEQLIVTEAHKKVYKIEPEKLFDGNKEIDFEKKSDYVISKYPKEKILKDENRKEYIWRKKKNRDDEKWGVWIQLIDNDNDEREKAISEYFFEDGVDAIYQGRDRKGKIKIKKSIAKDKMLKLEKLPEFKDQPIKLSINTHNLNQQRRSVEELNRMPVMEYHENLIKLFEPLYLQNSNESRNKLWKNNYRINSIKMEDWYILNDDSYDGTNEQRRFVEKAIATPDFAFLEGPPGSGKTTAILELILQLIKRGKRIMLSASTHVAIDNVLERIEEKDRDNLVVALRIGDRSRVGEAIKKFQIDEKIDKLNLDKKLAEKLVLDSANLVCGTTMGIQQHPSIKYRNKELPIYPEYDYLIIDESSKTTFQEFLVPALFAKKWILVGDIMQLSPYIEQSHIIHNFNVMFDDDIKKATRLAFETLYNSQNPYVVEINDNQAKIMDKYLNHWFEKDEKENLFDDKNVVYICNQYFDTEFIDIIEVSNISDSKNLFWILISDLIIFEKGLWNQIKDYIPKRFLKIIKSKKIDKFDFQQAYMHKEKKLPYYKKINRNENKEKNPLEYTRFFKEMLKEKTWAEEIVWRMIRVYELRMLERKNLSYYEKSYELLKPIDMKNSDEKKVDRLYHMTLPSILESLQKGNGEKGKKKTTLTEGFDKKVFKMRHEKLVYQHRMHPDISKFSRDMFYTKDKEVALLDGTNLNRDWSYHRYPCHAVWIDIKKEDRFRDNKNEMEAKKVIKELELFIKFAKNNPKEDPWTVGVITFYRPQEALLRDKLRKLCNKPNSISRFKKDGVEILNYTVDKFQGMEADIIFLSMVRNKSVGFLDNINRLNVAITRAKYQRVIIGNLEFFKTNGSYELKKLAAEKCYKEKKLAEKDKIFRG